MDTPSPPGRGPLGGVSSGLPHHLTWGNSLKPETSAAGGSTPERPPGVPPLGTLKPKTPQTVYRGGAFPGPPIQV